MRDQKKIGATLLVLGGGRGERMGGNKFFLSVDGEPVVHRLLRMACGLFAGVVFCVGLGEREDAERMLYLLGAGGACVTADRAACRGPLEGLRQGLDAMETAWGFLLGVDMLHAQEAVIRQMWARASDDADVVAYARDGRPQALHAFYRKNCLPHIDAALSEEKGEKKSARGGPKIISFYNDVHVRKIFDADLAHIPGYARSFDNFNTRAELDALASGTRSLR